MKSNYKQGKSDMMNEINRRESEIKSDKWIWWLLVATAIYFTFHVGVAFATSTPPTMQCTSNGMGTIICYPI
jgi:uncharacterized membrane protein